MKYFFLFGFVLMFNTANAVVGCVRNNRMYTDRNGNSNNYKGEVPPLTPNNGCFWAPTTNPVTACTIQNGADAGAGYEAYDSPQNCDIDSDILFLIVSSLGLGIFVIRKKTCIALSN